MASPPPTVMDPPSSAPVPTIKPPRRRRSWTQRTILGLCVVVLLAILAGIAAVGYTYYRFNQINKEKLSLSKATGGPQNYLIVGSDSRAEVDKSDPNYKGLVSNKADQAGQRSDTIIIMRVDPKTHAVDMVSLPRDLWVPIAGTGESQRINTAYSLDNGRQRLIDTIQQDFGIPINHYVEVDFEGFQGVVNAIGGVPMYFDEPMRDDMSGLSVTNPGCVTLDGEQALAFARARHLEYKDPTSKRWKSDPTGDLGRITRQQIFVRNVINRAASKATSLDVRGTNDLIDAAVKNLTVDSGFGLDTMVALGREFKAFSGDQMVSHTLPATPYTTPGGADVLKLDTAGAQPIFDLFKGTQAAPQMQPSEVTLSVRNGSGVNGAAAKSQTALASLGFVVSATDTGTVTTRTSVRYGTGAEDQANLVARHVKGGADVTADSTLAEGQVQLVIGKDYVSIVDDSGKTVTGAAPSSSTSKNPTTTAPASISDPVGEGPGVAPEGVTCG